MENKIVPKLRFPEFNIDGGWEKKLLKDFLKFQTGYPFESVGFNEQGKGIRLIKNRDLKSDDKIVYYNGLFDDKYIVNDGDILVGMDGDFSLCIWNKGKALLNQRVGRIMASTRGEEIFFHYLLTIQLRLIEDKTPRTTVKHLSHSDVEKIIEPLPKSYLEQQKIADCLSSLDDLITGENEKLEALKKHKKGLMQHLFPAEGEKVPKLRFSEFKESEDWADELLEDVSIFLKGKGISKADINPKGYQSCIRYGELYTTYTEIIDKVYSSTNIPVEDLMLSELNDVIIPSSGETQVDIATASCVLHSGIALGGDLNIIRSNINGIFMAYYLSHNKKNAISKMAQGNAVVHLYSSQLKKLRINFPISKVEQQKIADCLSSLDSQISAQTQRIEQLKIHKKGLMQQLFPNAN